MKPKFNPDFRPGLHEALRHAYQTWNKKHPKHTLLQAQKQYTAAYQELKPNFPVWTHYKRSATFAELQEGDLFVLPIAEQMVTHRKHNNQAVSLKGKTAEVKQDQTVWVE